MTAKSSKGVQVSVQRSDATGITLTPTDISLAKPAVVTVDDTTGVAPGDIVVIPTSATGLAELDGTTFIAGEVTPTSIELLGSDTSASTGIFASTADIIVYDQTDMVIICLASLSFNPETPDTISVGTYCDPTATIASAVVSAGTVDITGYPDINDEDYNELLAMEADGTERIWRIMLPNNGYYVFPATLTTLTLDIPIDGAIQYNGTLVLGSKPRHIF